VWSSRFHARRAWQQGAGERPVSHEEPIGQRVLLPPFDVPRWLTIVGVVSNLPTRALTEAAPVPILYVPMMASRVGPPVGAMSYLVRTTRPTSDVLAAVRGVIRGVDGDLALAQVRTPARPPRRRVGPRSIHDGTAGHRGSGRPAARHDWQVWCDVIRGEPPHARNRRAACVGRCVVECRGDLAELAIEREEATRPDGNNKRQGAANATSSATYLARARPAH
jgi:hypothetical protein